MARQLTKTLKNLTNPNPNFPSLLPRLSSLFSTKPQFIEIDTDSPSHGGEIDVVASFSRLEDAIHRIIVQRLEPNWIAFRPGSSYWVPPSRSIADNLVKIVSKMNSTRNFSDEESLSILCSNGWPSSSFFLDSVETQLDSSTTQPDDESTRPLTEEESLSFTSAYGWPSSSDFLDQGSLPVVEMPLYSQIWDNGSLSEDED